MGILEYLLSPQRTQQAQMLGQNIQGALNAISGGRQNFNNLWEAAFADPKDPLKVTDPKALAALGDTSMNGLMSFAPAGIVKAKGGNWGDDIGGWVQENLLARGTQPPSKLERLQSVSPPLYESELKRNAPGYNVNAWANKKLANYIRNEMGTEADPIRKALDEGVNYTRPQEVTIGPSTLNQIAKKRAEFGFPVEGVATTPAGKDWENLADFLINPRTAGKVRAMSEDAYSPMGRSMKQMMAENPWIEKLPDEATINQFAMGQADSTGFKGIMDFLQNELQAGNMTKEQLDKTTVEQAVRRLGAYNDKIAAEMAKNTDGMPVVKDYGNYKWMQLTEPKQALPTPDKLPTGFVLSKSSTGGVWLDTPSGASYSGKTAEEAIKRAYEVDPSLAGNTRAKLEKALKYEGDTMGHCVGGYCEDVASGESKIYSLRDAKGEPHVTIEVIPRQIKTWDDVTAAVGKDEAAKLWREFDYIGGNNMDNTDAAFDMFIKNKGIQPAQEIKQIKGKQNLMPKEDYIPMVQDFVKSGRWANVKDWENTGFGYKSYDDFLQSTNSTGLLGGIQ